MSTTNELDPDIETRLDGLARATGRSKDSYLKEWIQQGMDAWKTPTSVPWKPTESAGVNRAPDPLMR